MSLTRRRLFATRVGSAGLLLTTVRSLRVQPVRFSSEFVTTSVSSGWPDQRLVDDWLAENPNIHYGDGKLHGYLNLTGTQDAVQADMIAVDDPLRVDSAAAAAASAWRDLFSPPVRFA